MVIIIGCTHHNTLSIVRALGEKNIFSVVILIDNDSRSSYVLASKYILKSHRCNSDKEALKILLTYADINDNPYVITTSDGITSLLDFHFNELKDQFKLFNCKEQGRLTHFMDKLVQVELARKCNFDIPSSVKYQIGSEPCKWDVYPCIVKPLESIHGGKRFNICYDETELSSVISSYDKEDVILIQQFIKRDYEIVIDGVSVNDEIVMPGYVKKYRDHKGGTNFSSTFPISELPNQIVENVERFIREIQYIGLFGVELIVSAKKYFFIEINLRNDATVFSIVRSGINLPYIYVNPKCIEDERKKSFCKLYSIVEVRDFRDAVLHRKIGLIEWFKDLKKSSCKYFYTKDDPRPFYVALKNVFCELINNIYHF